MTNDAHRRIMEPMAHFLDGKTIDGSYTVTTQLGEGAMGAVFLANDATGAQVALKVVLDGAPDVLRAPQRFFREVKSLNKLEHPNIVELLDFGRDEQLHLSYMVMEVVSGDDLSKLVAMGRCTPELALLVARHVADGLALAHEQGIVHRDLKPANVMLCPQPDGSVVAKVLDFGLAMLVDAETRLTKTGTAPGTVSYMSPEQLLGETADARTDIYGLGVILYEMLLGAPAFRGANQTEIALEVLQGRPPAPPHTKFPDVPRPLSELVAEMMRRDRAQRPSSADEVAERAAMIGVELRLEPVRVSHTGPADKPRAAWNLRPGARG